MNSLGIYFGPQGISIVETKGKRPINNIQIPLSVISSGKLFEEKVPEEIKLVAMLKDELTKNKIEAQEVNIVLSGRDLIIRTFDMPILPKEELASAVNFEVKKYIPFKLEDLISDFQRKIDKTNRKSYVLFVGIKKEALDKYLSVSDQLYSRTNSIEYSAFSVLRLLKLANIREKGILAVVSIDLMKDDETNFVVLEDGFPLFSRDINLISGLHEEVTDLGEERSGRVLERLKRELRISLDYYNRKFPAKHINKIFFIMEQDYQLDLGALIKEIGLNIQFIDISKYVDKTIPFSLASIKAYSGSLSEISTDLQINLLLAKERTIKKISAEKPAEAFLIRSIRPHFMVVAGCLLIFLLIFLFGLYRILPLQKELQNIIGLMPPVSTASLDARYEALTNLYSEYKQKVANLDNLIQKRLYLTSVLDVIPRLVPEGMWLVSLSFEDKKEENKIKLTLDGMAYLGDGDKELELANSFLSNLKNDPLFVKYFKDIRITSIDSKGIEDNTMTHFIISCCNYTGRD